MSFTRVDVWTLDADDPVLVAYGEAVTAMQAKPDDNPTSWVYQAAMHGTSVSAPPPLANGCRHGSWYFLSWHRMYLYYFEQIVRAQVIANGGPDSWALPYWNYDRDGAASLPTAFRTSGSPLYVEERNPAANAGGRLPKAITSAAFAMNRPSFTGASEFGGGIASAGGQFWSETGRLEQTPHNDVHVAIGGWMGDPATAALDPIFWLHHANIDRLWAQWQESHADPSELSWLDQAFDFADSTGRTVSMSTSQAVDIAGLDYLYDSSIVPVETVEAATGVSA